MGAVGADRSSASASVEAGVEAHHALAAASNSTQHAAARAQLASASALSASSPQSSPIRGAGPSVVRIGGAADVPSASAARAARRLLPPGAGGSASASASAGEGSDVSRLQQMMSHISQLSQSMQHQLNVKPVQLASADSAQATPQFQPLTAAPSHSTNLPPQQPLSSSSSANDQSLVPPPLPPLPATLIAPPHAARIPPSPQNKPSAAASASSTAFNAQAQTHTTSSAISMTNQNEVSGVVTAAAV
jgi:hypothetical protein